MIEKNLIFVDCFDSEFKNNTYKIYQFIDLDSMTVITGTNLNNNINLDNYKGKSIPCELGIKGNKIKVLSIKTK